MLDAPVFVNEFQQRINIVWFTTVHVEMQRVVFLEIVKGDMRRNDADNAGKAVFAVNSDGFEKLLHTDSLYKPVQELFQIATFYFRRWSTNRCDENSVMMDNHSVENGGGES